MGDFVHSDMLAKLDHDRRIRDQCLDILSRNFAPILTSDIRHALQQVEITGRDVVVRTMDGRNIHIYSDLVN